MLNVLLLCNLFYLCRAYGIYMGPEQPILVQARRFGASAHHFDALTRHLAAAPRR